MADRQGRDWVMTTYYGNHSGLLSVPRWVSGLEGALTGSGIGIWLMTGSWYLALIVSGIGALLMTAHILADCEPMSRRRWERRRIAKIKADRAAGIWPRRDGQ